MAGGKIAINARGCNAAGSILFRRQTTVESPRKRFRSAASRHAIAMRRLFTSRRCRCRPHSSSSERGDGNGGGTEGEYGSVTCISPAASGRVFRLVAAVLCSAAMVASASPASAKSRHGSARHSRASPVVRRIRGGILPIVMIGTAGTSLAGMPASSGAHAERVASANRSPVSDAATASPGFANGFGLLKVVAEPAATSTATRPAAVPCGARAS